MFLSIANLPFLTLTNLFGTQSFIDSYRYPSSFQYIKTDAIDNLNTHEGYLLIERPTHHGYAINEQDIILYHSSNQTITQRVVSSIVTKNGANTYFINDLPNGTCSEPINEQQIIGKIKARFDDNLWITMCLRIWQISSDNLNALVYFSNI